MRGFPQELFFVLLFGAVMLVQFLYGALRRRAVLMQTELEPQAAAEAEADAEAETVPVRQKAETTPVQGVESPRATLRVVPPRPSLRTEPRPRRFSRQDLLPDRRAVQDAIVIAAILRPCHAERPHGVE